MKLKSLVIAVGLSTLAVCGGAFADAGWDVVTLQFADSTFASQQIVEIAGVFNCSYGGDKNFGMGDYGNGLFKNTHALICRHSVHGHPWVGASFVIKFKNNPSTKTLKYRASRNDYLMHANDKLKCNVHGNSVNTLSIACTYKSK